MMFTCKSGSSLRYAGRPSANASATRESCHRNPDEPTAQGLPSESNKGQVESCGPPYPLVESCGRDSTPRADILTPMHNQPTIPEGLVKHGTPPGETATEVSSNTLPTAGSPVVDHDTMVGCPRNVPQLPAGRRVPSGTPDTCIADMARQSWFAM